MAEIRRVHDAVRPVETLFVVDSMTGQDAANTARTFNEVLPLTGVILTKADGDARGGAALSIRAITGKPIKFIGVGEKTAALEAFHPDRIASRILGMGDILSLVEEAEQKVDKEQVEKLARKISGGKGFDMNDFRDQLDQMLNMGGLAGLMDKLPGMGQLPKNAMMDDSQVHRMKAIINSMTPQERSFPAVIKGSRRRRIAAGFRHPGAGCESPPEAAPADAENDEKDVQGRHGQDASGHEGQVAARRPGVSVLSGGPSWGTTGIFIPANKKRWRGHRRILR